MLTFEGVSTRRGSAVTILNALPFPMLSSGGEGSGLEVTEEGGPPSSVTGGDNADVQDEEFHLGGFEDDSELLADLLNVRCGTSCLRTVLLATGVYCR